MTMFAQKYPNVTRTVRGSSVTVYNNDVILAVDTSSSACSITLDKIASGYWNTAWKLYIYDSSNNAAVNNITINAGSGQTINNAASITISVNGAGALIQIINNTSFLASTTITSAGGITSLTVSAPLTSSGGATPNISTSMSTNRLIGRGSPGSGVMEEIILGSNLSLSGTTLNATFNGVTNVTAVLPITSTGGTTPVISSSMSTNRLLGRGTAGTGVIEEIILGTNLSLSGNTLNAAGGTSGYTTVQEEGSSLTQRSTLNFIGDSVTAADDVGNSRTNVTVRAYSTVQDEGTPLTQRSKLNFIGSAVTVTDNAGTGATDITIIQGNDFLHAEKNIYATTSSYSPAIGTTRSVLSGTPILEWSSKTESGVTSFNTGNGQFTVATAGWYTLNTRLVTRINATSIDDNTNGSGSYWMTSPTDIGFVSVGIILSSASGNTRMIASNKQAVTQKISDINIDATCGSYYLNVGDILSVNILNQTNYTVQGFASSTSLPDCIFEFTAIKIK